MLIAVETEEFEGIPNGIEDLLTDFAIGAPANCALRLFGNEEEGKRKVRGRKKIGKREKRKLKGDQKRKEI